MSALSLSEIRERPAFKELVQKRRKMRVTMISMMMLVFIGYLFAWAFLPEFVNLRLPADSSVTIGIWITVVVVLVAILLSAYYAMIAGKQLDLLNEKLIKDIHHDAKK
ncbi:Uncharacterized membrane protein, DUF485 family [Colwellia chukchiensis]|uniref:Uncharacterized membrane protein, DUF485 family n=2 Tax=Colwellia chukchiensis TaxID=641665 RepID=A0A1H7KQ40_9GAMM|nr:Uncharacterized membrane protein, DUF485 family [Colwellia chukchiensis]